MRASTHVEVREYIENEDVSLQELAVQPLESPLNMEKLSSTEIEGRSVLASLAGEGRGDPLLG